MRAAMAEAGPHAVRSHPCAPKCRHAVRYATGTRAKAPPRRPFVQRQAHHWVRPALLDAQHPTAVWFGHAALAPKRRHIHRHRHAQCTHATRAAWLIPIRNPASQPSARFWSSHLVSHHPCSTPSPRPRHARMHVCTQARPQPHPALSSRHGPPTTLYVPAPAATMTNATAASPFPTGQHTRSRSPPVPTRNPGPRCLPQIRVHDAGAGGRGAPRRNCGRAALLGRRRVQLLARGRQHDGRLLEREVLQGV